MQRPCDQCSEGYEAVRSTSRFCSDRCRNRYRKHPATAAVVSLEVVACPPDGVAAVFEAELTDAGRLDTPRGQMVMVLARRLDNPARETGPALASLAKQLEASLSAALKGARVVPDGLDDLKARRDAKFG